MANTNTLKASGHFELLKGDTINYFLPETCGVSELRSLDSEYTATGVCYVFSIFLTFGVPIEFGFETEKEAMEVREAFIVELSNYYGPDQIIFANGFDFEVAVIHAVAGITDIYIKSGRASFSLIVDSMPYPVNLIFMDELAAAEAHRGLSQALLEYHRQLKNDVKTLKAVCA